MNYRYLPMTEEDKREMLEAIGVSKIDELFDDIPKSVRLKRELALKKPLGEASLIKELTALSNKNRNTKEVASFLGAGVYDHTIPSVVDAVISRSEFYTAYTPYQPEISQGELQAIFEFQTMICELTAMDVANSSMYDGSTALAEAALLSAHQTKKQTILVSKALHPEYIETLKTYARGQELNVVEIDVLEGVTNLDYLNQQLNDNIAAVIVQYPNFFGQIEPLKEIEKLTHEAKALFVVSSNPLALSILTPPGQFGADIVVGDVQVFGIPQAFGGPHCGYFAVTKKLMRKIPGRLVGQTVDEEGKRGFVLTLQAREQHIRRDKATSNICSNQALNALAASVSMSAFGKKGVVECAMQNIQKAHYAKQQFVKQGFDVLYSDAFFNEFVVRLNTPVKKVNQALLKRGIIGGFDLGNVDEALQNDMLVCVTELRSKEEIDSLIAEMGEYHA